MLKKGKPVNSGTPTFEGTLKSVVTLGAEGILTTAGPEQQQKSQLQHDAKTQEKPTT
jgi:hypothetical protein